MDNAPSHKRTWAAVIVAVLLVIPGTLVGALVAMLYRGFLGNRLGESSWFSTIALLWFPSLLHGAVAGAVAIYGTKLLFKSANLEIVSYSASAVWVAVGLIAGIVGTAAIGLQGDLVSLIAQVSGVVLGLFALQIGRS